MKKHNFTPIQSECILNAISKLIESNFNAYSFAWSINDTLSLALLGSVESLSSGKREIGLSADSFERIVSTNQCLSDFFFEVGEILDPDNALNAELLSLNKQS